MSNKWRILGGLIIASALAGCAAPPLKVDLEPRGSSPRLATSQVRITGISFVNKAADAVLVNNLFGDSYIPIRTEPSTRQTVENDIRRLLGELLITDPMASASLTVKIEQADAFWAFGVADRIPFVSLATAGADRDFLLNLKFSIEIEQSGKVRGTYSFEEKVMSRGSAAFPSNVKESYEKLISLYRQVLERALQADFVVRHL